MYKRVLIGSFLGLVLCAPSGSPVEDPPQPRNNVLIVVGDDIGCDVLRVYGADTLYGIQDLPALPTLASLASEGVVFTNAWSNPACCPTRATVQTGRYGFRTGLLNIVPQPPHDPGFGLDLESEILLPKLLKLILEPRGGSLATAAFGKWHLNTGDINDPELLLAPNRAGYDRYSGTLFNIDPPESYEVWQKVKDGTPMVEHRYATTVNVDEAFLWIADQEFAGRAWLVWLAFNAPHAPYHKPPSHLHSMDLAPVDCETNPRPCYLAMLQAMDTELGRLLDDLATLPGDVLARTTIFFFGDNGTPREVTVPPFDPEHAKQTLYEGGIRVPLIVSGYGIRNPGRVSDALVNLTDVFMTTLELFLGRGYDAYARDALPEGRVLDARSLMPILRDEATDIRDFVLSEAEVMGAAGKAIRNLHRDAEGQPVSSYKLIVFDSLDDNPGLRAREGRFAESHREFYELVGDPFETNNLYPAGIDQDNIADYLDLCEKLQALVGFDPPLDCQPPYRATTRSAPEPTAQQPSPLRVRPNPLLGRSRIELSGLPGDPEEEMTVAVQHVDGRRVAILWSGRLGNAPRSLVWNGTNDRGVRLPTGRYLVCVRVGASLRACRWVTILR
jgi:arylsulfatase A-like enzyme